MRCCYLWPAIHPGTTGFWRYLFVSSRHVGTVVLLTNYSQD